MLDRYLRPMAAAPLGWLARWLARCDATPDGVTLAGLGLGLSAALALVFHFDCLAMGLLCANRLADGLDGALARTTSPTDRGGYLDLVCDFIFYGAVPLAFILRDTAGNGLAGAALLFTFYVNGASVLAFAALAAKRGLETSGSDNRAIHFSDGMIEGGETILFFFAMMLFPAWFAPIAWIFAGLTLVTALVRVRQAWVLFND